VAALKTLDDSIRMLASRNLSTAMKAMSDVKQNEAARLLGCVPSVLSDWKDDHLERAMQTLAALGLKVVSKDDKPVPLAELNALKFFARKAMDEDPPSDFGAL
jgi:hypothetical protein